MNSKSEAVELQEPGVHCGRQGMTRRDFMKRAVAAGLTVSAAAGMWAHRAEASAPKRGGHAIFGIGAGETADSLNVDIPFNAAVRLVHLSLRSKLVENDPEGGLISDLATEWDAYDGGQKWIFKLRKDVEFHDGKTLDAQDVIDSINIHRGENTKSVGKPLAKPIEEVKADGHAVVFSLDAPNADFPNYLAQYMFQICPSKDGVPDQSGVGTGPFTLETYEPGVRGAGKRNPNYYNPEQPYFDSFELLSIKNSAAMNSALLTGEIHAGQPIDLKMANRLAGSQGLRIESIAGGSTITMPMQANLAPFDDVDFRLAMKYAVDREEMRDKIFHGHASLGNDHPIAPFDQFYYQGLPQREYDPEKAKFHLKKSGYEGAEIQLHASDAAFVGSVDAGVLFAESAKKVGINVTVKRASIDGYWNNIWTKVPFCFSYWNARPTPDLILSLTYISDAPFNETSWNNPKFDKLVAEARKQVDTAKRKELYAEIQGILHDDGSTILPLFQNIVHGISDKVGHGTIRGSGAFDDGLAFRTWWFNE